MNVSKFVTIGFPIFIFLVIILYIRGYIEQKNYDFAGVVQNIDYDIKGTPHLVINGKKYILSYNEWLFDHKCIGYYHGISRPPSRMCP